jgi:DNA repair ATPase RecN
MEDEMKRELNGVKSRLGQVETRLARVESRLDSIEELARKLTVNVSRLMGDMSEVKQVLAKADWASLRSDISSQFDKFGRSLEDSRYRWAIHADTLLSHDLRLKKLEARRS